MGFFKKLIKKAVPALIGGGIGFLTGGPIGATIGAAGALLSKDKKDEGGGFMEGTPAGGDVRSPAERALAESQARYFQGQMEQPDLGFQAEEATMDPYYARAQSRLKESIAGSAAEKGFGILQHGPSVSSFAKGAQEMEENRLAGTSARRAAHKQFVMSGGRAAATPTGRSSAVPAGQSGFSQLVGPAVGSMGQKAGSDIAGRFGDIVNWGKNLFGGGGSSGGYSGLSDRLRSPYS